MAKPVGHVIRELREAAGLPRSEAARKAQLDPSVLWRLENPKAGAQPSFELIRRVAAVIGVSLDEVAAEASRPRSAVVEPTARDHLNRIREAVDALDRTLSAGSRRNSRKAK